MLGIAEWYSPVVPGTNLLHPRPGSASDLKKYFPEIDTTIWPTSLYYPSRKGEDVAEVHDRIDGFLKAFPAALDRKKDAIDTRRVLFVSHAATVIVLVRALVGDRDLPLMVGCASLSELVPEDETGRTNLLGGWKAIKAADGSHLTGGSSREWGFNNIEVEKGRVSLLPRHARK